MNKLFPTSVVIFFLAFGLCGKTNAESFVFVEKLDEFKSRGEKIELMYPEKNPDVIATSQAWGSTFVQKGIAVYLRIGDGYMLQYFESFNSAGRTLKGSRGMRLNWEPKGHILTIDFLNEQPLKVVDLSYK